jgi:hypothetical protein
MVQALQRPVVQPQRSPHSALQKKNRKAAQQTIAQFF